MLLEYLGISRSQQDIGRMVEIREGFGTPASMITKLSIRQVQVQFRIGGTLAEIQQWLLDGKPVIALVDASELRYEGHTDGQHALLVVALDHQQLLIHDPAMPTGPISVPIGDFLLAWDEMNHRCATITRR